MYNCIFIRNSAHPCLWIVQHKKACTKIYKEDKNQISSFVDVTSDVCDISLSERYNYVYRL